MTNFFTINNNNIFTLCNGNFTLQISPDEVNAMLRLSTVTSMRPLVRRSLSWISRLSMPLYLLAFGLIVLPALLCILVTSFAAWMSLNVLIHV